MNAAARVITGTRKFDRGLGQILHDQLHWLDVSDRLLFKLAVTVLHLAPTPRSNFAEIFGVRKLESLSYRVVLFV